MRLLWSIFVCSVLGATVTGCSQNQAADIATEPVSTVSFDASRFVLADEPDGAVGVIEARESGKDGEPIIVVGRIGGAANPWIEGRAAFMILDCSKSIVAKGTESSESEMCTEDCCAAERAECTTLVKVVDAEGRVLAADSRQLLGVASDDMVVIQGKVSKDQAGNFVVLADGVYVRR